MLEIIKRCYASTFITQCQPTSSFFETDMRRIIRHGVVKFSTTDYVRSVIAEQADLSAFREKPSPTILVGIFAVVISFIIGWPAVALFGLLSLKLHNPWIVGVGGPLIYGFSHLVFILGMYLSGATYSLIFLRWFTRVSMERLLAWADE